MKKRVLGNQVITKKWILIFLVCLGILIVGISMFMIYLKQQSDEKQDDDEIVIGFCADNLVIERWQRDQEIFMARAKEKGANVLVYNANESNDTQVQQIKSLIDKKVDVIVVIPYDKDGLSDVILEAKKAGIKVIAYDRLINNVGIDAYISFDNVKVGELQSKALVNVVPKGNYLIINGSPEDNNSSMFREGYMNILNPYIENKSIRIIGEVWANDWREEPAYNLITETLEKGMHIDAVIGANDRLAEAAIRALSEEGLAGDVYVAGHDADISACQRIIEGTQYVTIYKPIRKLAEEAVDLAIRLAKNEENSSTETINNGVMDVPYYKLDVLTVTKETMKETVIDDGFHLEEDIYRN